MGTNRPWRDEMKRDGRTFVGLNKLGRFLGPEGFIFIEEFYIISRI
jgi:hypothetical protein